MQHVPAIRKITSTGKATFFNGIAGTYGSAKAAGALEPPFKIKNGPGYKLPSSYGDGTSIPSKYLDRLIEIQDEIQFLVPWQPTDIALVNNYTVQVCVALFQTLKFEFNLVPLAFSVSVDWKAVSTCQFMGRYQRFRRLQQVFILSNFGAS